MRAINNQRLQAQRDNRNHWKIAKADLTAWSADNVRTVKGAHPNDTDQLRVKLAAETARADAAERAQQQAETDRDKWQAMAQTLAERPRFNWPWKPHPKRNQSHET